MKICSPFQCRTEYFDLCGASGDRAPYFARSMQRYGKILALFFFLPVEKKLQGTRKNKYEWPQTNSKV